MNKRKVLARLATYLRPYWKQTLALCLMILSSAALGLVAPYLTRPLMDVVLAPPPGVALALEQRYAWLGLIVLGMLGGQICGQGISLLQGRVAAWMTHQLAHDLRSQLYRHLSDQRCGRQPLRRARPRGA